MVRHFGDRPITPTPALLPTALPTPTFWEAIPTLNLSFADAFIPPATQTPTPTPIPTFAFVFEEEHDGEAFTEESAAEGLVRQLWHLWQLLRQTVLRLLVNFNSFLKKHPYLGGEKRCEKPSRHFSWQNFANHSISPAWSFCYSPSCFAELRSAACCFWPAGIAVRASTCCRPCCSALALSAAHTFMARFAAIPAVCIQYENPGPSARGERPQRATSRDATSSVHRSPPCRIRFARGATCIWYGLCASATDRLWWRV